MAKDLDGDKKYFRILKILNLLNDSGRVRVGDLSAEFNVSVRSVQRDLERVNMSFGLVETSKGEYAFAPGVSLRETKLSNEQLSALIAMHDMAASLAPALSKSVSGVFSRLAKAKPWESPYHIIVPRVDQVRTAKTLEDLEYAITNLRKVRFEYDLAGGKPERTALPLKILIDEGFYYLFCLPEGRGKEFRKYRVDQILSLAVLPEEFEYPASAGKALSQALSVWSIASGPKVKARLLVAASAAKYFRSRAYFPKQKVVRELKDGSLEIEAELSQEMEAIPVVLKWIPKVSVLAPKSLKDRVKTLVSEYSKKIA